MKLNTRVLMALLPILRRAKTLDYNHEEVLVEHYADGIRYTVTDGTCLLSVLDEIGESPSFDAGCLSVPGLRAYLATKGEAAETVLQAHMSVERAALFPPWRSGGYLPDPYSPDTPGRHVAPQIGINPDLCAALFGAIAKLVPKGRGCPVVWEHTGDLRPIRLNSTIPKKDGSQYIITGIIMPMRLG